MNSKLENNRISTYDSDRDGVFDKSAIPSSTSGSDPLESNSVSGVSAIDISRFSNTYKYYTLHFNLLAETDSVDLFVRAETSGGIQSASDDYAYVLRRIDTNGNSANSQSTSSSEILLSRKGRLGNDANDQISGTLQIYEPYNSNKKTYFTYEFGYRFIDTEFLAGYMHGQYLTTETVTGIRLLMSSGNITGSYVLQGQS